MVKKGEGEGDKTTVEPVFKNTLVDEGGLPYFEPKPVITGKESSQMTGTGIFQEHAPSNASSTLSFNGADPGHNNIKDAYVNERGLPYYDGKEPDLGGNGYVVEAPAAKKSRKKIATDTLMKIKVIEVIKGLKAKKDKGRYCWKDKNGLPHISQTPPPESIITGKESSQMTGVGNFQEQAPSNTSSTISLYGVEPGHETKINLKDSFVNEQGLPYYDGKEPEFGDEGYMGAAPAAKKSRKKIATDTLFKIRVLSAIKELTDRSRYYWKDKEGLPHISSTPPPKKALGSWIKPPPVTEKNSKALKKE
ncbi:hypothetical protein ACFL35_05630 [Candidatus Riflebacteria bacterium]